MIGLNELLAKKAKYENDKIFIDAKIAVVDEMIEEEQSKCVETVEDVEEVLTENEETADQETV